MTRIFRTISTLMILCTASTLLSQSGDIRNDFNKGLILYRNNDMQKAHEVFVDISRQSTNNELFTSALLLAAKSSYALENYDEAIQYSRRLIDDYSQSRYRAHAYYVRAASHFQKGNYSTSALDFTYCIEFSDTPDLLRRAESTATNLVDGYIGSASLEKIYNAYNWKKAQPILTIWRAHFAAKHGESEKSRQMLQTFINSNPDVRYKIIAEELASTHSVQQTSVTRIGIIQPLAGYFASESSDFLKGLAFAVQKSRDAALKIEFVLKETNGGIVETINAARELLDDNVDLVITGLEGQKSAAAAGILQPSGIPIIIPVSTDNNLAQLGDNVFQTNSDMETRGSELAEYAIKSMYMKNFATLAPADEYGNALTDAFTNKIDQLGGTIVSQQWYYPGTSDFSRQLESIREASFRYAYRDSIRAWGMDVNMARLDSLYARLDRSARYESDDNERLSEYTDIAARSIDGFFLPIYEEDIPYIASQFALYNIKARLLGGDSWNSSELLRKQQRYVNGVVFFAGHHIDEADLKYISFVRDFRIATSSTPGTMAIYGYNIMNLLIDGISNGAVHAAALSEYLDGVKMYQGLGANISFQNKNRINSAVNILQFQDGNIIRPQQQH